MTFGQVHPPHDMTLPSESSGRDEGLTVHAR
jgi:hypothetical protein